MGWLSQLGKHIGYEDPEPEGDEAKVTTTGHRGSLLSRLRVVRGRPTISVFIIAPRKLEDARRAAEKLLAGSAIFVNLQHIPSSQAQRIVDILAGVSFAVQGTCYEVGKRLFLFAPPQIVAAGDEETVKEVPALFTGIGELTEGEYELPVR